MNRLLICYLTVVTMFIGFVVGQQALQQQNLAAPTCDYTTTKPTPETKKYVFQSCIVAQMATYLSFPDGKYLLLNNGSVDVNSSKCDVSINMTKTEPMLVVKFDCGTLSFNINHTNDSKTYVAAISGQYTTNASTTTFSNSTPTFSTTQSGHYYKCNAEQVIPVKPTTNLVVSNFALEAYRTVPGTDFYQIEEECPLDSQPVSDLVRIGVGVCLIALVAIVLIAYFIGRRRWSERSSYESV